MSWSEVKKINSDLSTPLNEGGVKIVKSIQRGTTKLASGAQGTTTINISKVNPSKCMIILHSSFGTWNAQSYGQLTNGVLFAELTETTLVVNFMGSNGNHNWQVIEFY